MSLKTNEINLNIGYSFLVQLLSQAVGFIVGVLIARLLGPSGKGAYAILLADVNLFVLFFGISINTGITYFIAKKNISQAAINGIALYNIVLGASLALLFLFYASGSDLLLPIFFPKNHQGWFFKSFVLLAFLFTLINGTFKSYFAGKKKFGTINRINISNSLLGLVLYSSVFIMEHKSILIQDAIFYVLSVQLFILIVVFGLYLRGFLRTRPKLLLKINSKDIKVFYRFIFVGHLSILLNFINYRFDLWVINEYCTPEELGYYSLAANLGNLLLIFTTTLISIILPYFTEASEKKREYYLKLFSRINFSIMLFSGFILFLAADFLIPFIYGMDFKPSVIPFLILLPGFLFSAGTKIFAQYMISLRVLRYNLLATGVGFSITVILNLIYIPQFGIVAASVITSFVYFVIFAIVFLYATRYTSNQFANYFIVTIRDIKHFKYLIHG